jgi:hypothetical protein
MGGMPSPFATFRPVTVPNGLCHAAPPDTKGQALRILALFFLALLPWISANIGGLLLLGPRVQIVGTPQAITSLVMGGVLQTITLALTAVIALLRIYGSRRAGQASGTATGAPA